jgi:hypothetical protein
MLTCPRPRTYLLSMNARSVSPLRLAIALRLVERARDPQTRAAAIRRYVALKGSK